MTASAPHTQPSTNYPSTEAMKAAVELEIQKCLGAVQTIGIGQLIQKVVDAESASLKARIEELEHAMRGLQEAKHDAMVRAEELERMLREARRFIDPARDPTALTSAAMRSRIDAILNPTGAK